MGQKVGYWASTSIMAAMMMLDSALYLSSAPVAVAGFTHIGYPQYLRIILGVAKLCGAYAGFTFAWILATVAHYMAGDGVKAILPAVLLVLLVVSYRTRTASRRLALTSM